jgi:predicted CoA-binding protein
LFSNPSDETIAKILTHARTIAIVGLSDDPTRASYQVAKYLQTNGYQIIPVNPHADEILGETAIPSLQDVDDAVDIINVFRRSEALPEIIEASLALSAPVIWAQLGIYNEEAAAIGLQHGKTIIMDRCIKIEHARLV